MAYSISQSTGTCMLHRLKNVNSRANALINTRGLVSAFISIPFKLFRGFLLFFSQLHFVHLNKQRDVLLEERIITFNQHLYARLNCKQTVMAKGSLAAKQCLGIPLE